MFGINKLKEGLREARKELDSVKKNNRALSWCIKHAPCYRINQKTGNGTCKDVTVESRQEFEQNGFEFSFVTNYRYRYAFEKGTETIHVFGEWLR